MRITAMAAMIRLDRRCLLGSRPRGFEAEEKPGRRGLEREADASRLRLDGIQPFILPRDLTGGEMNGEDPAKDVCGWAVRTWWWRAGMGRKDGNDTTGEWQRDTCPVAPPVLRKTASRLAVAVG